MDHRGDPADFREYWKRNYGPTIAVYRYTASQPDRVDDLDRDFLSFLTTWNRSGTADRSVYHAEYLLITARKPDPARLAGRPASPRARCVGHPANPELPAGSVEHRREHLAGQPFELRRRAVDGIEQHQFGARGGDLPAARRRTAAGVPATATASRSRRPNQPYNSSSAAPMRARAAAGSSSTAT